MKPLFCPEAFGKLVKHNLALGGVSLREAENLCGVDKATICRVTQGKSPTVENYLRLKRWMEQK